MSYIALMTDRFDEVVRFYGSDLGFPIVEQWERPNARGVRFDTGSMRLEILDNGRERKPLQLGDSADRFHLVIEVEDIDASRKSINVDAPSPQSTSWGCRLFQIRDPDGVPVTYLQWTDVDSRAVEKIHGKLTAGADRGKHFTRLDWARQQFIDKLCIDPYPGTLNLIVDDQESRSAWERLKDSQGVKIDNPNTGADECDACCFPVSIGGKVDAAIVLPEVADYSPNQIELIAAEGLRATLDIDDGDSLTLEIKQGTKRKLT